MTLSRLFLLLTAGLAAAALAPLRADDPKADDDPAALVEDFATAHELAAFAKAHKSPEAYITAASLLLKIDALTHGKAGAPPAEMTVVGADNKETAEAVKAGQKLSSQATAWFDDARTLGSKSNLEKEVAALITAAKARKYEAPKAEEVTAKGKAGGPANLTKTINAGDTHVYKWKFEGGKTAAIGSVSGSKIHTKVVSPNGGELFALLGQKATFRWLPKQDGTFIIRIHNPTKTPTTYTLASN